METHSIVSPEEWLEARVALLAEEKALTKARDALSAKRRALPWVKVDKEYEFDGTNGKMPFADLFGGRSQLIVYHFMLGPGWDEGCTGCSFVCDHVDSARMHFEHADASFAAVSRAPLPEIEAYKKRMDWTFQWVSSFGSDFNYDYNVSFTPEQLEKGEVLYNFRPEKLNIEEMHGTSVFIKDENGDIFHTYSSYGRGCEMALGAFAFLDLTPKGRSEQGTMSWVRRHDQYEDAPAASCGCASETVTP